MLVTDPIRYWARNIPDQAAIVFDGHDTLSYRQYDEWTDRVAHRLVDSGLRPGDRIGIVGPNSLEWCVAAVGAMKAGVIVAPYNNRFVAAELSVLVRVSEPTVVFADVGHLDTMSKVDASVDFELVSLEEITSLRHGEVRPFDRIDIDPDAVVDILFTSGTTSVPKGVTFTHRTIHAFVYEWTLMEPVYSVGVRMEFVLSLAGMPGINWAVLNMLIHGGTLYLETGFDPALTLRRLEEERIQIFMGVPVLLEQIAQVPGFAEADLSALEALTVGGARVPLPALEAWLSKGIEARQIYGMTELGGTSIANPRDQAILRPNSVGTDSIFMHHKVVRDDGTECDPGEPGEIIARGPAITPGYWRNDEATADAMRDGWFHSGDIGVRDDEGYLSMVDRKKDMIITGGYNLAPSEVEAVIYELPGVVEAAVIGVDDERFGEAVAAIVKADRGMDARTVIDHCAERLAKYKVPSYVVISDELLPRMPSGKLAKRELRETYADLPARTEPPT